MSRVLMVEFLMSRVVTVPFLMSAPVIIEPATAPPVAESSRAPAAMAITGALRSSLVLMLSTLGPIRP